MKAYPLQVESFRGENIETVVGQLTGCVIAANIPDFEAGNGYLFNKGEVLGELDKTGTLLKFKSLVKHAPPGFALHLIELEEGEISEDQAGKKLAALIAGPGLELHPPVESRVNMIARLRGLLKIDLERLQALNEVEGVAVFTLYDAQAVVAGTEVAGAKVIPLVFPVKRLSEVQSICDSGPVIDVLPFRSSKVGVIARQWLPPKARSRFEEAVTKKMAWFGAELLGVEISLEDSEDLSRKMGHFKEQGATLIILAGGHASDPLDPVFGALESLGVRMEKLGAPAHPGTLFWLAYWDETALFGLASCGMFSKTTLGDLLLAQHFAGIKLTRKDIAKLGQGGLFNREMSFRFPPYGLENLQD